MQPVDTWKNKLNSLTPDIRQLLSGSSSSFLIRTLAVVISLFIQIVLARQLGATSFGEYTLVITCALLFAQFSCFGFDTSSVRFISAYKSSSQLDLLGGIIRTSFVIPFSISITLSILIVSFTCSDIFIIQDIRVETIIAGALVIPILTLSTIRQSALRALKHVTLSLLPDNIFRPLILISISTYLYLSSPNSVTSSQAMVAYIASAMFAFILGIIFLAKKLPKTTSVSYQNRYWINTSIPLLLAASMTILMSKADIIMIGFLISPKDSGIYAIASQLSEFVPFGLFALNIILAPMISDFHTKNLHDKIQSVVSLTTKLASGFAVSIAAIFFFFGEIILKQFGLEFTAAYYSFCILLVGQIFNVFSGPVVVILSMVSQEKVAAKIIFIATALNILLNFILIPAIGLEGAAIATATSLIFWNVLMAIYIWKKLNINSTLFSYAQK